MTISTTDLLGPLGFSHNCLGPTMYKRDQNSRLLPAWGKPSQPNKGLLCHETLKAGILGLPIEADAAPNILHDAECASWAGRYPTVTVWKSTGG